MIRPLNSNVLIQPVASNKVSAGGIHLPRGEKTGAERGIVFAVAKGVEGVADGDTILYDAHAPTIDAGDGERMISIDYIMAVLA